MAIPIVYSIPRTRKGLKITMIIMAVICVGLSVFAFISWSGEKKAIAESGQPDFNTLAQSGYKDDMYVSGSIALAVDCFAEDYETNYGVRTSDKSAALYYLVPVYDTNSDGTITIRYFVTYKAEPKDFDTMDKTVSQMWSTDPLTTSLTLQNAQVMNMPADLQQYMGEWINDKSFYQNGSFIDWCVEYNVLGTTNRDEIASKLAPYIIYSTDGPTSTLTAGFVTAGLALFFIVMFFVLKYVKRPIKGIIDTPGQEDFSKLRSFEVPPMPEENSNGAGEENHEGSDG